MWLLARRRVHVSIVIGLLCAGFVVGVFAAAFVKVGTLSSVAWLLVALVILMASIWKRYVALIPFVLISGILMGLWRGGGVQQELAVYDHLIGRTVTLTGVIAEDTDINARGQTTVRLREVSINNHDVGGQVWVAFTDKSEAKRSDILHVEGELSEGFGAFSVALYSPRVIRIERPVPGDVALHVRDWFGEAVRRVIPEPQASLGLGYLVGQRRGLPSELEQALQIAGLTHIIVASGYNLTILVRFARRAFERVSKYLSALSASLMILSFIAVTGISPSMSRAGLVAGLSLLAWYYGRAFHPFILISFAAAITLMVNPSYAWGDLGWLLSFAAFGGVMILAPLLQVYFFGEKKPGTLRQILGETISAQIATMPILIVAFGSISNVALLANLLILPLVPLAMILVFVAGIASLIHPLAGEIVALPATWLLSYMTMVAEQLSGLAWAQSDVSLGIGGVAIMYCCIVAGCVYMQRRTRFLLRSTNLVE